MGIMWSEFVRGGKAWKDHAPDPADDDFSPYAAGYRAQKAAFEIYMRRRSEERFPCMTLHMGQHISLTNYIDPICTDDTTTSSPSMERTVESVTGEIVGHLKAGRVGRQGKSDIRDALDKSDRDGALGRAIIGRVIP